MSLQKKPESNRDKRTFLKMAETWERMARDYDQRIKLLNEKARQGD